MGAIDNSAVLPAYMDPPVPTLTFDGSTATLTGVRWVWWDTCWHCRTSTYVIADGGTITTGLSHYRSHSGKTDVTKWFDKEKPARPTHLPTTCEHCGQNRPFCRSSGFAGGFSKGGPHGEHVVLNEAWAALRVRYPDMAVKADAALRAGGMQSRSAGDPR
jgi:hypothetical protein